MPAYGHCFGPEFYDDVKEALKEMSPHDWADMIREVFNDNGDTTVDDVVEQIRKVNTISGLASPIRVWIDPVGWHTVDVY